MFQANVLRIFIASPMDVRRDRTTVKDSILHWNVVHADRRGIVFLPIGWETHGVPDTRQSAQDLIDKKLLTPCDVLVGLFWTSIGTRTKNAVSGTVHEITQFMQANKRAAIYFCRKNIPPQHASSAREVETLRRRLNSVDSGLTGTYTRPASLRDNIDMLLNEVASEYSSSTGKP